MCIIVGIALTVMPASAVDFTLTAAKSTETSGVQLLRRRGLCLNGNEGSLLCRGAAANTTGNAVASLIAAVGALESGTLAATVLFAAVAVPASSIADDFLWHSLVADKLRNVKKFDL